jgi:SPP1 gp7 family putative phage head morphogenesis protein
MAVTTDPFGLEPTAALAWFRQKGYALNFDWRDMWGEQHARAFTVAKATQLDVLADIRDAVDKAIADGVPPQQFRKGLRPALEAKGWWGEKEQVDPVTGEKRLVQLGSARRLNTILETNLRQTQAAARWERVERSARERPYLRYVCLRDGRERKEHRAWHGIILPWDDPWWDKHYPPNGWGCRCKVVQLSDRDLERYGFKVAKKAPPVRYETYENERTGAVVRVPRGVDPSFDYNAGKARRGFTPPDSAPVLTPVRSYLDYGRAPAKQVQAGQPRSPELWPREHGPADRQRTDDLFRATFGIGPKAREATIKDRQGEEVTVSLDLLDHLRGAHRKEGQPTDARTQYAALVRSTLEQPFEVWMVPFRLNDGRVVMRKRYVGVYSDLQELVVVNRGDDGYVAWTVMPKDNIDSQRQGYLLYPR